MDQGADGFDPKIRKTIRKDGDDDDILNNPLAIFEKRPGATTVPGLFKIASNILVLFA